MVNLIYVVYVIMTLMAGWSISPDTVFSRSTVWFVCSGMDARLS